MLTLSKQIRCVFNSFGCSRSMCSEKVGNAQIKRSKRKLNKYYSPNLSEEAIKEIRSIAGLTVGSSQIGFAKVEIAENVITELKTLSLPKDKHTFSLHELYSLTAGTLQFLPKADHYILENAQRTPGKGGPLYVAVEASRQQFMAMLVALLNSSNGENGRYSTIFLRSFLSGRLFKLIVGNEVVTGRNVMNQILQNEHNANFTPVKVKSEVISNYVNGNNIDQDFMAQATLIALTFAELIIYENKECYKILNYRPAIAKNVPVSADESI